MDEKQPRAALMLNDPFARANLITSHGFLREKDVLCRPGAEEEVVRGHGFALKSRQM